MGRNMWHNRECDDVREDSKVDYDPEERHTSRPVHSGSVAKDQQSAKNCECTHDPCSYLTLKTCVGVSERTFRCVDATHYIYLYI